MELQLEPAIVACRITKRYERGTEHVDALRDVSFTVNQGELVAVVGRSGSGKTTLLNLAGGLDLPTSGHLDVAGERFSDMSESRRAAVRRDKIGIVFQHFALDPALTALDNVMLALLFARRLHAAHEARALLDRVGLGNRLQHRTGQLSGGEMQRVAIARAIVKEPRLILADEPTGNLDTRTGAEIFSLMREVAAENNITILMSTHDPYLAESADRKLILEDGCLSEQVG